MFIVADYAALKVIYNIEVGCFATLKVTYNIKYQTDMRLYPEHQITRHAVGKHASKVYIKASSPDYLISAFRRTGVV